MRKKSKKFVLDSYSTITNLKITVQLKNNLDEVIFTKSSINDLHRYDVICLSKKDLRKLFLHIGLENIKKIMEEE